MHSKALIELGLQERFDAAEQSVSHVLDEPMFSPPGYRGYSGTDPLSLLAEAIA